MNSPLFSLRNGVLARQFIILSAFHHYDHSNKNRRGRHVHKIQRNVYHRETCRYDKAIRSENSDVNLEQLLSPYYILKFANH